MPKIIENLREQIIEEARNQLFSVGYARTTIRSVASGCGIGVGTVYNYFPSKDLLISSFMLEDWHDCTKRIAALNPDHFEEFFTGINDALTDFVKKYEFLFRDKDASAVFASAFSERHIQLRNQISKIIEPACHSKTDDFQDREFLTNYISESILIWVMSGADIRDQLIVLKRLIK
jgi:AcrR family transcriptional regulator